MTNRRSFVQGAVLVAATPALGSLMSLSTTVRPNALLHGEPITPQQVPAVTAAAFGIFKIDGWDRYEGAATDRPKPESVDLASNDWNCDRTLIRLTQSWRTAWR
jgi:hypothetical protein